MSPLKTTLNVTASTLRLLSKAILNWPWVLALVCVISPISPHVRIPYELSYSQCDYIGTRGIITLGETDCPWIAIIDTSNTERVVW